MKKIYFFLGFVVLLSACTKTPQQQAQNNVKAFLQENLLNPNEYKSISFDTIRNITEKDTLLWTLDFLESNLSYSSDSVAVLASIKLCKEKLEKPGVDTNIVIRTIDHAYKHKGLDNQPVELSVTFQLDNNYQVVDYNQGIQGQGFFDVFIVTIPNEYKRVERFTIDGYPQSVGTGKLKLAYGTHAITWWGADKSLVSDMYLPAIPHDDKIYLYDHKNDSVPGIRIITLDGYYMAMYSSIEDFRKSNEGITLKLE